MELEIFTFSLSDFVKEKVRVLKNALSSSFSSVIGKKIGLSSKEWHRLGWQQREAKKYKGWQKR